MPPQVPKRSSTPIALNNKSREVPVAEHNGHHHRCQSAPPLKREKLYQEFVPRTIDESERLELEDNDPHSDVEENDGANVGMKEHWKMEYRIGEEMMEDIMEGGEELREEEEVDEEDVGDDHSEELDGIEKKHHVVVKERRTRKEFEVFVGGLDRDATEEDLRKAFGRVGDITEVRLLKNPVTKKNKGFAFLRFATVEQARRAVSELKHPVINGKQCGVAPSQDSVTLFVGNICREWTKETMKEKLAYYGVDKFEELTLIEDTKNWGMNRGFAFLEFSSRADALEACKVLQNRDVVFGTDRTARVAFAVTFNEPDDEIMSQVRIVFVDSLPSTWDEDCVKGHLKKFGRIEKVELARNMPAARRTDFGFITFDTHDAAVACVDSINNTELGYGDEKVKIRARLSRPRQRGKSAKHARGGYPIRHGDHWGVKSAWDSSLSPMDPGGLQAIVEETYNGGLKQSLNPRYRLPMFVPNRVGSRRKFPSLDRSLCQSSSVSTYGKSDLQKDCMQQDDSFSRPSYFARGPMERHSYRDAYSSHDSKSSARSFSRGVASRLSPLYGEDDSYGRYMERPFSNHSSFSGSKRSYSEIEKAHPFYAESSIRLSRTRFDYGTSRSHLYDDSSYGSDSTRLRPSSHSGYAGGRSCSAGHSHGLYDAGTSKENSRRDARGLYSSYSRDYGSWDCLPSQSDLGIVSYSSAYSNRHIKDSYSGGRGSATYY